MLRIAKLLKPPAPRDNCYFWEISSPVRSRYTLLGLPSRAEGRHRSTTFASKNDLSLWMLTDSPVSLVLGHGVMTGDRFVTLPRVHSPYSWTPIDSLAVA